MADLDLDLSTNKVIGLKADLRAISRHAQGVGQLLRTPAKVLRDVVEDEPVVANAQPELEAFACRVLIAFLPRVRPFLGVAYLHRVNPSRHDLSLHARGGWGV